MAEVLCAQVTGADDNGNAVMSGSNACFAHSTSGTDSIYTASVIVTTSQPQGSIRGIAITKTVQTFVQFSIKLQEQLNVTATLGSVAGNSNVQAAVVSQIYYNLPSGS